MMQAQSFSPHPGAGIQVQPHPQAQSGHPMAQGHPGQGGQPQQMHMGVGVGVSGPRGPHMQNNAVMAGMMPQGPSPHALQHLTPQSSQAQFLAQQQQQMFANNPQMQQQFLLQQSQRQAAAQHQAQQRALMAQYGQQSMNSGMMPNGMPNQMNQAQFAAMRGMQPGMRHVQGVALPQHLQQQQVQLGIQAQQQEAQHQQQQLIAQQMVMQNSQGGGQQPNARQMAQIQQSMQAQHAQQQQQQQAQHQAHQQQAAHQVAQQQQAAQQQQQAAAAAQQQDQHHNSSQSQGQTPQQSHTQHNTPQQAAQQIPQPATQMQISQQTMAQSQQQQQQQQQLMLMQQTMQAQAQAREKGGLYTMVMKNFADKLSNFSTETKPLSSYSGMDLQAAKDRKKDDDKALWTMFVRQFFSQSGVMRHSLSVQEDKKDVGETKQYEIPFTTLPQYWHKHFLSGIVNIQMIVEKGIEKPMLNSNYCYESESTRFLNWFDNGSLLVASGSLQVHFNSEAKIELLEFITDYHEELMPRGKVIEAARPLHEWNKEWLSVNASSDGKQSPEMTKKGKNKVLKSPPNPPPEIDLPSKLKTTMGVTEQVFEFLEMSEVLNSLAPLFDYANLHPAMNTVDLLAHYNHNMANSNGPHAMVAMGSQGGASGGPRTPSMGQFNIGPSPATAHLNLPEGNGMMGSPAQMHQAANMVQQQSQPGASSSDPSASTSPNQSNKRRRPSTVKVEEVDNSMNGSGKVKPSPKVGGKRQKSTA